MQTDHVKMALMAAWVLAIGTLGYVSGTTSLAMWTVLALVSLLPPVVMARLWSTPDPSMSETIRKELR
jgi:hypothetical protein